MAGTPNSFKDPYWTQLASVTEDKLQLPKGLLTTIVSRGERSNADQVSEAGAKTVFQIIPATRDAALKKYGVDAYLSPENAAEVAGLLLKESLARNQGDAAAAVGEYHGGTDRSNWGPRTKSYINRVMVGLKEQQKAQQAPAADTFDRVKAEMTGTPTPQIAAIYAAYQQGQMTPQEAAEFEADVKSGAVMLPRGATLNGQTATDPSVLPPGVLDAYAEGRMDEKDKALLLEDLRAGLVKLPPGAVLGQSSKVAQIPGMVTDPVVPAADPSLVQKALGTAEAALSTVTGATGGMAGMVGGALGGLAGQVATGQLGTQEGTRNAAAAAAAGAERLTYEPRTESGQQQAAAVGQAMQQLIPIAPLAAESALLAAGATPARQAASAGASRAAQRVGQAVQPVREAVAAVPGKVAEMVGREPVAPAPTPGTLPSVGSAGVDMALQRRQQAAELPIPVELTKGQAERSFELQRFEQEAAKDPTLGQPLRDRFADQNARILQNFDAWVDMTGAEAPNLRAVGQSVDKALVAKAARDKTEIRATYKAAEKAGELMAPVATDSIVKFLTDSSSAESLAPVLGATRKELVRLGGAALDDAGNLVPREMTLADAELLRKLVNRVAGADPTNIKYAVDVKKVIDAATDGLGGDLYKKARGLRTRYAQQYENVGVIDKLLTTKRGTSDRQVAFEDVFNHAVLKGSLDDMRTVRKVLQTGGDEGRQAWKELQGATIQYLKDEATKNAARDTRGNPVISAAALHRAITELDRDGKLAYLFGKRGAEQLRSVNDLVKHIYTAPPGSVNHSNTASVLLAALDMAISGSAGMPLPVASGIRLLTRHVKDQKVRRRINDSLNDKKPEKKAPAPKKPKQTLH